MKKRKLVLTLLLLIVQAFFVVVPVFASEDTGEKVMKETAVSFSETTIKQDMADKLTDLVSYMGAVTNDVSLIAFTAERTKDKADKFNLYFYLYVPNSPSRGNITSAKVTVSKKVGDTPQVLTLKQIDRDNTVYKFAITGVSDSVLNYDGKKMISFEIYNFSLNAVSYPAVGYAFSGGKAESSVTLTYDVDQSDAAVTSTSEDGKYKRYNLAAPNVVKDETLSLNTTLVSERVTTPTADKYMQINTAMITIPNKYFNLYGKLAEVEYIYSLWDKVPMLVTDNETFYKRIAITTGNPYITEWRVPTTVSNAPIQIPESAEYKNYLPLSLDFCFYINSIGNTKGSQYDVSAETILKKFQNYLKHYNALLDSIYEKDPSLRDIVFGDDSKENMELVKRFASYFDSDFDFLMFANHKKDILTSVKASDVIKSESYTSANDWWSKLWSGKLLQLNVDDSVTLPGISIFDNADLSKTDEELSKKYCIDATEIYKLRSLASLSNTHKICFLRYATTEYNVYGNISRLSGGIGMIDDPYTYGFSEKNNTKLVGSGYYCENSIIQDFQILKLHFEKTDQRLGTIARTTVLVEDQKQDYVGGTESGPKLQDEKTQNPMIGLWDWFKGLFKPSKLDLLWKGFLIVLIALIVFFLLRLLLRLIPAIRMAAQRSKSNSKSKTISSKNQKKGQSVNVRISFDEEKR